MSRRRGDCRVETKTEEEIGRETESRLREGDKVAALHFFLKHTNTEAELLLVRACLKASSAAHTVNLLL